MTTLVATEPAAAAETPRPPGPIQFLGNDRFYLRLLVRGAVMLLLTLGLYRFWLTTDVRRYLWSHTEVAGHSLEYTGTALELLLGFLIAIAILVPLYAAFFFLALQMGIIGQLAGLVAFMVLALLGQYAVYRARRYRLTRTVYRGIRFHQTGSAWRFAVCALFWWSMTILTFGLAYPWTQANLERFKMGNTAYGDLPGHFTGSAWRLFLRGFPMWLIVVGPFLYAAFTAVASTDWAALSSSLGHGDNPLGGIEGSNPDLPASVVVAGLAGGWSLLAAAVLYPFFQAVVLRWWSAGLRFGPIQISSRLRTAQVYRVYLRFLWHAVVFFLATVAVVTIELTVISALGGDDSTSTGVEVTVVAVLVATYVIIALAFSTIYQATVKFSLWRLGMESVDLSNIGALETVRAKGTASGSVGEGLADALNVGGL